MQVKVLDRRQHVATRCIADDIFTVHGSVWSFLCVCVCVIRSLRLLALPSYRTPDELIITVTGVARLLCPYLARVSVVCCQIIVGHILSCALSVLLVPETVSPGSCFH